MATTFSLGQYVDVGLEVGMGVIEPGLHNTWPRSISSFLVPRSRTPMLSPAWPWSRILRNISTPVHTVLAVGRNPTISTGSLILTMPCSTLPVATVPRPEMVKTSSTGIKKGLSISRTGSGMNESTASISLSTPSAASASPSSALRAETADDGVSSPGNSYAAEQLADLELHQFEQLLVFHGVHFVERHDDRGDPDLAGQQHVLTGLGHRPVGRRHHQDRTVDLRRARDHVLDVVGVAGHVDVGVVTLVGLVLDVCDVDRDAPLPLFGCLVDGVEGSEGVVLRVVRGKDLGYRRGQGRLTVVDVPHRPDVEVGLRALEFLLGH